MRPGKNVTTSTSVPPNPSPTATGTWFPVGRASQGPNTPVLIRSFAQYQTVFGGRGNVSAVVWDSVERYFIEGGSALWFCRPIPASSKAGAVSAKGEVETAKTSLNFKANGVGTWANTVEVVIAGAKEAFTLTVKYKGKEETSPVFKTLAEAVTWCATTQYVTATIGEANETPKNATLTLSGGEEGSMGSETEEAEALQKAAELFTEAMGPGQLSFPGVSTTKAIKALFEVATKQNRRAVADLPNYAAEGATVAEQESKLKAAGKTVEGYGEIARNGALFASWQTVPPALGLVTSRVVPPSPFVAAKAAVIDGLGNPNLPIAGKQGILPSSLGFNTALFGEVQIEALYNAGVNVCKEVNGQVRLYGNRTPANRETEPLYSQFSNSRLDMAIIWGGLAIEEELMFSQIDGQGKDQALYASRLNVMMLGFYKVGAVFGESPQDAYAVDAGSDVNTPMTEQEGDLNATVAARRSPGADQVNLAVVRVGLTQEV
jgi:hypothetical protein